MIEDRLSELISGALRSALPEVGADAAPPSIELSKPKQKDFGDFSTNIALALAGRARRSPRDVATAIVAHLPPDDLLERAEVAGPGFINLFVRDDWLYEVLRRVVAQGPRYGWAEPHGHSVNVEFVSANPTGPLHIGHARNAVIGDGLARVMEAAGWRVEREYYFNDAGRQMGLFGASVEARYLQLLGRPVELPEEGYRGEYLIDVARDIAAAFGDSLADLSEDERHGRLLHEGAERVLAMITRTLERFGVRFDVYFSERTLHGSGEIDETVRRLREVGHAYEHEGAVFFRSTTFGDDKDRVLIRSNGAPTYFAADCAYL
ncbi:MAG TPA: arginine--tRNA ligase, partial [Actinomycetota bacterium]|nr:arginine--tRNA ligase [Actinomycetota bacterium]